MPIITLSRGTYTGTRAVAEAVAERLGFPCVSREILLEAATNAGVETKDFEEVLAKPPSLFERLSKQRRIYLAFIRSALCEQATAGSFVYQGLHGHLLLGDLPGVVRLRVLAPFESRVATLVEREEMTERAAETYIRRVDRNRSKWTKFLYDVDWNDPTLHDLTLNLDNVSVEEACDLVCRLADSPRFAWTNERRQRTKDIALASRTLAALAMSGELFSSELEITASSGVLKMRGSTRSGDVRDAIREVAARVPGVEALQCEVSIPSDALRS